MKAFKQKCSLLLVLAMLLSLLPLPVVGDVTTTPAYADSVIPTANLDLWLKADAGVTADANGKVSQWADQSGQGNHVSQTVDGKFPSLVTDAVYGKPAIRFDGDVNGNKKQFLSKQLSVPYTGNSTVIMVMKLNSLKQFSNKGIFATDIASNIGAWAIATNYTSDPSTAVQKLIAFGPLSSGTANSDLESASTLNTAILTVTHDQDKGEVKAYQNGVSSGGRTNDSLKTMGTFKHYVIGKSYSPSNLHMAADVSEVLVYQRVLSTSERQAVENYLTNKYYAVSPVVANVPSGAITAGQAVTLSTPTVGASVYYTLDSSDPLTSGTRLLYSSPIVISNNTTIKAAAKGNGLTDSPVSTFTYTLTNKLVAPTSSVPTGNVSFGKMVTLTSSAGTTIRYTIDGTDPKTSASGKDYTAPFSIVANTKLRAYAIKAGMTDSDESVYNYTVTLAEPVKANAVSGAIFNGGKIKLTSTIDGASIYYTLDGSDPVSSGTKLLYTAPIVVTAATTIKTYAELNGTVGTAVAQYEYTIYTPTSTSSVTNLPDSYYNRDGLENMPHLNYEAMKVANVKDFGAIGDGNASDAEAFEKAINALNSVDGGVVYVPKGFYYFPFDLTDPLNRWAWKRNYNNVHFIGEGDESVIRFKLPGIPTLPEGRTWTNRNGVFSGFAYGWRIDGKDISYKDLAFSWYPRYDARGGAGGYTVATSGENIQMNRVTIDQGNIGAVFWQNTKNVYVVDTQVRNTAADSIHFANVANVVAAYNLVDGANDDSIASIDDKEYNVADNHQYLHNTILNSYWGRGITVTGTNSRVEDNWLENIKSSGVYTNNGGQSSVSGNGHDTEHLLIKNNTIVRSGLMGLNDNQKGAIAFNQYKDDLIVDNNHIYGGQSHGIYFNPWGPASTISNVRIKNNEIAAVAGSAMVFNSNIKVNNIDIMNNDMFGNELRLPPIDPSINFNASVLSGNVNLSNNKVSGTVSNTTYAYGFPKVTTQPVYTDPYAAIAAEPSEIAWAGAPIVTTAANEINVKNYGAKGDGSTNDTQAFYDALDAIPASGGTLRIPAGTYVLPPMPGKETRPYSQIKHHLLLEGRDNVHIVGDGDSSVLHFTSADHYGIRLLNATNSSIRNVKLELANKPFLRHNRSLLDITGSKGIVAEHVTVANSGGSGIQVDASTGVSIQGSTVIGSNMSGILLVASRQVYVENSTLKGNRDHAIFVNKQGSLARQSEYIRLAGNVIDGEGNSEQSGIAFASGDNILATGNTIKNTHMAGVLFYYTSEVYPTDKITVTGNTLINTNTGTNTLTYGAISSMMSKGGNFTITENTIQSTPYSGIWVKDSTLQSLKLTANSFTDTATKGGAIIDIASDQLKTIQQYTANTDQIAVQTKPERISSGSGWAIEVTIQNLMTLQPSSGGTVSVTSPMEWAASFAPVTFGEIAPSQSTTVRIPIPAPLPANIGAVPYSLKIDQIGTITNLTRSVNFYASAETQMPPVIDGTASEWMDTNAAMLNQASQVKFTASDWAGADDLSATGYVKHDATNLYFSVVVKDNVHTQTNTGSDIWRGDSLQLAIDAGRATTSGQSGYSSELTFALTADNQPAKWRSTAPNGKATGNQFSSALAVKRDEANKTTTYELALPWTEILPDALINAPERIGISFLINDDDGAGRRGWIEYMSGIGSSKNPSLYGDLLLVQTPTNIAATGVMLDKGTLQFDLVNPQTTQKLTAAVLPANATNKDVTWISSNPAVATVAVDGTVTAHAVGNSVITVTTVDGGFTATSQVTVGNSTTTNSSSPIGGSVGIKEGKVELTDAGIVISLDAASKVSESKDGNKLTSIQVNDDLMAKALDAIENNGKGNKTIIIQENESSGLQLEISGKAAAALEKEKDTMLTLIVGKQTMNVPASLLDFEQLAQEWQVKQDDLKVKFVVKPASQDDKKKVNSLATTTGVTLATEVINFGILVEAGNRQQDIHSYGSMYLTQTMTFQAISNVNKVTGVMIDQTTGEMVFVPATFTVVNGQTVATLRSNGSGIFAIVQSDKNFKDMKGHWAEDDVITLASKLLVKGMTSDGFDPEAAVTRAQFAVMLSRSLGLTHQKSTKQEFKDVHEADWFSRQLNAALQAGLIDGYADGTMRPNDTITREQMAVMIARALQFTKSDIQLVNGQKRPLVSSFADHALMEEWAKDAINKCLETGLMQGISESSFGADANATRAQAAVTLSRLLKYAKFIN
ncbi:chitobiase/beta-hexosaminidase C-terminal domain-containing protein [Paenibacillus qinlingensis]|uniref:Polygalacturonase n=1 Tax=Paenibacillus qinlingensis TaxID=1837343 RepID=A0ABU1NU85_9BACL|nr:chitobiase/beta-hexosaminidase C-terminal domain-containing protein [Paenibacillus qinlingensis]MDR6551043.1 polygalacturonase [Paenibacillus qinlingensis]